MTRERAIAIAQTVTILIFFSLGTILTKLSLSEVSPLTFTWVSLLIGGVVLSTYTFVLRKERIPRNLGKQVWTYIFIIGFFNFVIGRFSQMFALSLMPATTNAYISNFIGFITMAMSIFILKESPTLFQIIGALIAFSGLRVFFLEIPPASEVLGIVITFIGITGIAFTNNIARKLAIVTDFKLSNNIISTLALLIGGSLTVAIGLILDWPPQISGWQNWGALIYSGIVGAAIGLTVWNHVLRTLRSYEASILGASTVIWTALLAIPFLGEKLAINQIIGIALMLTGLALVQVRGGRIDLLTSKIRALRGNK
jgi:drug/metabolite transporter (DMT)-like permease